MSSSLQSHTQYTYALSSGESDLVLIQERLERRKIRLHLVRMGEELLVLSLKEASDLRNIYALFT
jgi:hypothetical protein